jgi:hypothetical protein
MNGIARFEALAEWLVEGTFARLFAGYLHPLEVATHLARAMEDHRFFAPDGTPLAPTRYWVYLHPQDFGLLSAARPSLAEDLVEHVTGLAQEAGLVLSDTPVISVEPLLSVPLHSVRIEARWQASEEGEPGATREMTADEHAVVRRAAAQVVAGSPFLISGGERHIALDEPVISIGRGLDNDIILEDLRVSRHHAQLRRRYGRYVLYDVGSSGGTTINGYPVQECVLQPGDVISFAGAEMIYGEDPPDSPPPAGEDTPVLRADDDAAESGG